MNILIIGGGGREHALAWCLKKGKSVSKVYAAPGNPGMQGVERITITDHEELADFAVEKKIDLTVVGPEVPLCDGIVDRFRARGLTIFGPDKNAAQLEGDKNFAKAFMSRHQIPTARAETFSNAAAALAALARLGAPIVVKAAGLAAGKGVRVCMTREEAEEAIRHCFSGGFGKAGETVLLEEYMDGEEASIFAFLDHHTITPLVSSQDHKRLKDGDVGPNTGGMGAYSPAPVVDAALWEKIETRILQPFLAGCRADGLDYRGLIYVGIMVKNGEPRVVEFNVRFGDPETQPVLMRLKSDLADAMLATVENRLDQYQFEWTDENAVCVVMASGGYPGSYKKGRKITGIEKAEEIAGVKVFHAGTRLGQDGLETAGGRVLGVTALRPSIAEAIKAAYQGVDAISWQDACFRRDIGYRALNRQNGTGA